MKAKQFVKSINSLGEKVAKEYKTGKYPAVIKSCMEKLKITPVNHQTAYRDELSSLLNNYELDEFEIGDFRFFEGYTVTEKFLLFGTFDLDFLAVDRETREVVLVDHDDPNFVMLKCSQNSESFIEVVYKYTELMFARLMMNDEVFDKEKAMRGDGNDKYADFIKLIVGTTDSE